MYPLGASLLFDDRFLTLFPHFGSGVSGFSPIFTPFHTFLAHFRRMFLFPGLCWEV